MRISRILALLLAGGFLLTLAEHATGAVADVRQVIFDCPADAVRASFFGTVYQDCVFVSDPEEDGRSYLMIYSFNQRHLWKLTQVVKNSDAKFEAINLSQYKDERYTGPKSGMGIYLDFPGKSSVIFYWDGKDQKIQEFWETD